MDRELRTLAAVLAASDVLSCPLIAAQRNDAPLRREKPQVTQVNRNADGTKDGTKPPIPRASPQPATVTDDGSRKPADENVAIQRDIAASTRMLARDTERYANYTFLLVIIGAIIGVAQVVILIWQSKATGKTATAALLTAEATQQAQRAYVAQSPVEPGLIIQEAAAGPHGVPISMAIQVHNWGQTPASVTDVFLRFYIAARLPDLPPYADRLPLGESNVFLVASGDVFHHGQFFIDGTQCQLIESGQSRLWILGYVDYTDVFGKRHLAGFARRYAHGVVPDNLLFEPTAGYNYDRNTDDQNH